MRMRSLFIALLFIVRALAADRFDSVRALIKKEIGRGDVPSIAIAVAKDGKILWEEGFGWADRERRVPATEHTMYSLASISKPFTATGLMVLVERKLIDLDRPVNDYLGEARVRGRAGEAEQATVRRVANHTAGLPLHYHFFYADEPFRPPSMDETIRRYGNLVTAPGERYEYSNLGYGILDYAISRVTGRSYADFMREEVFTALGLTRTSVNLPAGLEKYQAIRYGSDGRPIPFYDFDHRGASAVYASAHDLVRFGMFHLKAHLAGQKAILSDESILAMQARTAVSGRRSGYGIGWAIGDSATGYRVVSHTGGMGGVSTGLYLIPEEKVVVAVLANSMTSLPHRLADETLAALLPKWIIGSPPASGTAPEFRPAPELAGEWSGAICTYKAELPFALRISEAGKVEVRLSGRKTELSDVRWQDGTLSGRFSGDVGTEDANRRPYFIQLSLRLRGDALNGAATAISLPGRRLGNALTQWAELKRQ
jgi:CubicO group peptidase (beta-lactamase class C family)